MALSIMALSIMGVFVTLSKMTLSIIGLLVTLSITVISDDMLSVAFINVILSVVMRIAIVLVSLF